MYRLPSYTKWPAMGTSCMILASMEVNYTGSGCKVVCDSCKMITDVSKIKDNREMKRFHSNECYFTDGNASKYDLTKENNRGAFTFDSVLDIVPEIGNTLTHIFRCNSADHILATLMIFLCPCTKSEGPAKLQEIILASRSNATEDGTDGTFINVARKIQPVLDYIWREVPKPTSKFASIQMRIDSYEQTDIPTVLIRLWAITGVFCKGDLGEYIYVCYECETEFLNSEIMSNYDPWILHGTRSPRCQHILKTRGEDFIHDCIQLLMPRRLPPYVSA